MSESETPRPWQGFGEPEGPGVTPPPPVGEHDVVAHEPRRPRTAVAWATLGVLAAAAVAGGVYVSAASVGPGGTPTVAAAADATTAPASPSASATPGSPAAPWGPHGMRHGEGHPWGWGGPGMRGFGGNLLHGEATVQTPQGLQVVDVQVGTVTAVDAHSITVRSSDNVTFSYTVDASTKVVDFALPRGTSATISDVKVGDTVRVVAVRNGATRTAKMIADGQPQHGKARVAPSPSPSATGASA